MVEIFYYTYVIIVGLLIGSFLNVCICRIPKGESIVTPSSHCVKCDHKLKWFELIPVFSYLFLKGKCRKCGEKISLRYALVEMLTALIFVILFHKYGIEKIGDFIAAAFFMSVMIVVFFIDLEHMIIPNGVVVTGIIGGMAAGIYSAFINPLEIYGDDKWWNPFLGAVIGFGVLLLIALLGYLVYRTEDVMGGGDIKIFAPIGLFLGWKMALMTFFISVILAGIVSVILILLKIKDRKSGIPFGPFIVAGTFLTYLFGWDLLNWYIERVFG
ncbi:prepilin peptidase [Acetivibrio saccincola]|uniref:Prepilin peptidase n=3 Tax=Acetivibrio saccincola TaxID=1677857 RepID=A0A2K9EQB0_9FIRM|nr:A24 family peptidase [Acetivibrio saccincola]AUG57680.1 Type 4 prepilin-like proteins leader peptide-processing enzyme [Acetivibrio saccincola]PQQ67573.1 prepilin peptidase [Acetivibrio saccincola]HOA97602.1 prepilin peptidase [Acetivibrio saccincola]